MAEVSLVPASFDRERHLPLLLEADDAEEHIRGYLDGGELLEIHGADGMIGAVRIENRDGTSREAVFRYRRTR